MRHLRRIAGWTAGLFAGLAVLLVLAYAGLIAAGYRPVSVYSGSMVPTLSVGSLAVVKPVATSSIRVGDVITFNDPFIHGRRVTHRIIRVAVKADGTRAFRTKGDANPTRDPWTIALPNRVGRVSFDVPYAGYGLVYAGTREVRMALILLSSGTLLTLALMSIWRKPEPELAESGASVG
jgi:signal peptidase